MAVKVWKTTDRVDYISHVGGGWGGGGASTVILSQQSKGLEGGGGSTEILSQNRGLEGGKGGRGEGRIQCDSFCERLCRNNVVFGW